MIRLNLGQRVQLRSPALSRALGFALSRALSRAFREHSLPSVHRKVSVSRLVNDCENVKQFTFLSVQPSRRIGSRDSIPSDFEVVVVGGGCVGVSLAYHLAKAGVKKVALLEKTELTSGSTWHAAGSASFFNPGVNMKRIHHYSIHFWREIERETGQQIGIHSPGSVRLATTPQRFDEMLHQMSRHGWHEAEQRLVSPEEIVRLCPIIEAEGILGGIFNPGDGHVDPNSLTMSLAKGAKMRGVEIYQQTPVLQTLLHENGSWSISTPRGTLLAKRVVNAAGFWGREVGRLAGIDLPLAAVDHQYIVTQTIADVESLEREIPVMRDLEGSYSLRMERKGLIVGPYETADKTRVLDDWYKVGVPLGFGKELFPPNLDRIEENLEKAMERFPCLVEGKIQNVIAGPITYSPDHLPLLGPYHPLPNYWVALGFAYGIAQCGGVGKYLADWMTRGEPPMDLTETDPNRFGSWADPGFVLAKVREGYGFNNRIVWPEDDRPAGRPTWRRSPLARVLSAAGAETRFHAGWERPHWFATETARGFEPSFRRHNWFEAVRDEVSHVTTGVGVVDLTPMTKIGVVGVDAMEFLDGVVGNKIPAPGKCRVAHMLTPMGKVYSEVTIININDTEFLLIADAKAEGHALRWLQTLARGHLGSVRRLSGSTVPWRVELVNHTDQLAIIGLAGPRSRDLLSKLIPDDVSSKGWPFMTSKRVVIGGDSGGIRCRATRLSYTGELGWEILVPFADAEKVFFALKEAGEEFGGLRDFGALALESMRLEKGLRRSGFDISLDTNPFEGGLEDFVMMEKKAEFVGKSALKKILDAGLKRKLVMMEVEPNSDGPDCHGFESVWFEDRVVGHVTSGAFGHMTQKSLCFAYLPLHLTEAGQRVLVELLGQWRPATVLQHAPLRTEAKKEKCR